MLSTRSGTANSHDHGRDAALRHMQALFASVDDVGNIARAEGINCDYDKGGVVTVARLPFQDAYAREEVDDAVSLGIHPDDIVYLSKAEARARLNATNVVSGVWYRHGAAIHPAKLVHGLARAAESRGLRSTNPRGSRRFDKMVSLLVVASYRPT